VWVSEMMVSGMWEGDDVVRVQWMDWRGLWGTVGRLLY